MKILYLAFWDGKHSLIHILNKISNQITELKRISSDSKGYIIGNNHDSLDFKNFAFTYLDLLKYETFSWDHYRHIAFANARLVVEMEKPDLIYMRYPFADKALDAFIEEYKNVVFEHQTKELEELKILGYKDVYNSEKLLGKKILKSVAGLVGVNEDFLEHQYQRSHADTPGYVMGNGICVNDLPIKKCSTIKNQINILCLADFNKWHGYDRLLKGFNNYKDKNLIRIYMVGEGREKPILQKYVTENNLNKYVIFTGYLYGKELNKLIDNIHVAIGNIGIHRMGNSIISTIKHREYCARGLPFCYAGIDPDFSDSIPFQHLIPPNETPVDFISLVEFAKNISGKKSVIQTMRKYAFDHLDWKIKIKNLYSFLSGLSYEKYFVNKNRISKNSFFISLDDNLYNSQKRYLYRHSDDMDKLAFYSLSFKNNKPKSASNAVVEVLLNQKHFNIWHMHIIEMFQKKYICSQSVFEKCLKHITYLLEKKNRKNILEHYYHASLNKHIYEFNKSAHSFKNVIKRTKEIGLKGKAFFHLGEILFFQKKYSKSIVYFKKCLQYFPKHLLASQYIELLTQIDESYTSKTLSNYFIIISGSSFYSDILKGYINSHPMADVDGEIFYNNGDISVEEIMRNFIARQKKSKKIKGCIISYNDSPINFNQSKQLWNILSKNKKIKILHLKRNNFLYTYVYNAIAQKNDSQFNDDKNKCLKLNNNRIKINLKDCYNFIRKSIRHERIVNVYLKNNDILDVFYDDFHIHPEIENQKILKFLNLEKLELRTRRKQQKQKSLKDLIDNFDEVNAYFLNSKWHYMLKDE